MAQTQPNVEPITAGSVSPGDVLAANDMVGFPRSALVMTVTALPAGKVALHVVDALTWPFNDGECKEAQLKYDAVTMVGRRRQEQS